MVPEISKIRGIHPGAVLRRELKNSGIKKKELAVRIDEYPQTISAIITERRGINPMLSVKLGNFFNVDATYFMLLQAYYDVEIAIRNRNQTNKPDLNKIREILFWDTDISKIDWQKQAPYVLLRVLERGNESEFNELIRFYGHAKMKVIYKKLQKQNPAIKNSVFSIRFQRDEM